MHTIIVLSEILDVHSKNIQISFNDDGTVDYKITDDNFGAVDNVKANVADPGFLDGLKDKLEESKQMVVNDVKPNDEIEAHVDCN